ncbi:MAG: hypothetical protein K9L64_00290 [Candidatus Izimaplasma sp.]|nr:hypothetical protein [Candidatus Izimaplasma bacterium]
MNDYNLETLTTKKLLLEVFPNNSFSMDKLNDIVQDLVKNEMFDQAIKLLKEFKEKANLKTQKDMLKLHNLYIDIFLITEDYKSLLNILKSREKYLLENKDFLYQNFYLAICYEGLEELNKAIETLESIPENISCKNLTNKYLKLALLYLELDQINKAQSAYKLALKFDKDKKNDIFLLVESDLAYAKGDYQEALIYYEDFFIQTKRKYSYLNRFIKINLQLNQLDDAYSFYKTYKDKIKQQVSLNSKICFFKAALPLLSQINKGEYQEVNNYLSDLINQKPLEMDEFNDYNLILKNVKRNKTYYKSREIIRDLFIDLSETKRFEKLCYVKIIDGLVHLLHFNKSLLFEKKVEEDYLLFNDLKYDKFLKTYKATEVNDLIFLNDKVDYIFVEKIKEKEFIVTYINEDNFSLAKKFTILASDLLKNNLNEFTIKAEQNKYIKNTKKLLNHDELALLKISNNFVYFLNDYAKELFLQKKDFINFDVFQNKLDEIVYLDELLGKSKVDISFNKKPIKLQIEKDQYDLYILAKAKTNQNNTITLDTLSLNNQESIILLSLNDYLDYINVNSYIDYLKLKNNIKGFIKKQANRHLKNIIPNGEQLIYFHLDTNDKRVAERISKQVVAEFLDVDIRVVYTKFNKPITELDKHLKNLIAFSTKEENIILTDKDYKLNKEKDRLYHELVKKFINEKQIDLKYALVKNWETDKLCFFDIDINEIELLKDKKRLTNLIKRYELGILYDRLIINQLINDLKYSNIKTKIIVPISKSSFESKKALNYLLKRLEIIKSNVIIFKLRFNDYLLIDDNLKEYLKTKDINLCFYDIFSEMKIDQMYFLDDAKYLMINPKEYNNKFIKTINDMLVVSKKAIIYDHQNESLIKSDLKNKGIFYIKGSFAGEVKDKSVFKKKNQN